MNPKRLRKSWWLWLVLGIAVIYLLNTALSSDSPYKKVTTAQALDAISRGQVVKATQHDKEQYVDLDLKSQIKGSSKVSFSYPADASERVYDALLKNVPASGKDGGYGTSVSESSAWFSILGSFLPLLLIGGLLFWVMSQVQGGGNRVMSFGRSKAKLVGKDTPKTTFADVAGADEAVEELHEIKDFLQNPTRYQLLGAKIPKGVLLYGPPGTGKTLLARAVAGEAGVPFYSISGSDFVEMFVGVGASRVRDLFEQAKENAPAIIFVDEIDAVGRHRGAGMGGGHDEREQTLNQLLVEMDGFDVKGGVILIAATNRPDILDPALLRPGRFDRQIAVGAPDIEGRKAVLAVHAKGKPLAPDVDLAVIARRTPGFTGADLANVINEAALLTARNDGRLITGASLEEAIDRVIAGPERKTRAMSDKEKRVTAYHEAGHALTAWAMPNLDPVHKLTILPRGRSLGHTLVLPLEDRFTQTRSEMLDQLVYGLGGRAAEELVFHEPTTGASNDIEKATALARAMVTEYGMSSKLGAVKYGTSAAEPFLGRDYGHERDYSEEIASEIDIEVRDLIEAAHDEAWEILVQYRDLLDQMVLELVERETLNKEDLERILAPVRKRPPHNSFNGFGKRTPSDKPPVEIPSREELAARTAQRTYGGPPSVYGEPSNGAGGAHALPEGGAYGTPSMAGASGAAPAEYTPTPSIPPLPPYPDVPGLSGGFGGLQPSPAGGLPSVGVPMEKYQAIPPAAPVTPPPPATPPPTYAPQPTVQPVAPMNPYAVPQPNPFGPASDFDAPTYNSPLTTPSGSEEVTPNPYAPPPSGSSSTGTSETTGPVASPDDPEDGNTEWR